MATSSANITNGGPVVIENPEMLKKDKTSATNGHDISRSSSNNSQAKSNKLYPQNPTDKQIEARTSDGRRRITPIFIPPPNVENGAPEQSTTSQRFGMVEFGSSSTQEKSRIAVEKRNDIVKPNISPGKTRENNENNQKSEDNNKTKQDTPTTSAASSVRKEEPKVNIIQVKYTGAENFFVKFIPFIPVIHKNFVKFQRAPMVWLIYQIFSQIQI